MAVYCLMNQEDALALLRPQLLRFAMLRLGNREEVRRELTISLSNCRVTLHRARKRLRECPDIRGLAADAV